MSLKETEQSLEEQIIVYNVTNRLIESAACFERILQVGEGRVQLGTGVAYGCGSSNLGSSTYCKQSEV